MYAICQRRKDKLEPVRRRISASRPRYTKLRRRADRPERRRRPHQLADPRPRAAEPRRPEGRQARGLHRADGHDGRGVPAIVEAQRASGKIYMMMETVVYSREYLFVKELYDSGELGRIQFLRGSHSAGHGRLARLLAGAAADALRHALRQPLPGLPGKQAESVVCHGSGRIRDKLTAKYGSPFAVETATFKMRDSRPVLPR